MPERPTVLGVITARGGSKGIPRKNIRPLLGRPLIGYTIDAAKGSALLTRCVVSTEDEEIAAVARSLGADVPFLRPPELARDESSSIDVLAHALRWMREHEGKAYDAVMILQPTSPLRTSDDIDACIEILGRTGADSVMSMVAVPDLSVEKLKTIVDGKILPLAAPEGKASKHRHELAPIYKRNTAIYLTRTRCIEMGDLFGADSRAHIMPRERSIDVNDPMDWELAEFFLRKRLDHAA